MRIGFVVNDVAAELPQYTTVRLALAATQLGHEVWLMGLGDFAYEPDGRLSARAHQAPGKRYRSLERYLEAVQKSDAETLRSDGVDVLVLRNDPAEDALERPWASTAALSFGQLFEQEGVLVVNAPSALAQALSKAYFQQFPEVVRPRTLITRDEQQIAAFVEEQGGRAVLKPLQGSGGSGVFLVTPSEQQNLNQIIEAIARDGYVVAQEYLPDAADGDVRLFVMNGDPLVVDGATAAFRRRNDTGDPRSNMKVGGSALAVTLTDEMRGLVDLVRPKLVADGMFLVGLDIVGDKLMEVNVFSPGGLGSCQQLYDVDFAVAVIADLERKVTVRAHYQPTMPEGPLAAT